MFDEIGFVKGSCFYDLVNLFFFYCFENVIFNYINYLSS